MNDMTDEVRPVSGGIRSLRGRLTAAAIGAAVLAGAVVGVGVLGAGAQDDPAVEDLEEAPDDYEAFESCLDQQFEDLDPEAFDTQDPEEIDALFESAEQSCADLLPADFEEDLAAWEDFDECLADVEDAHVDGSIVYIEGPDSENAVQFGPETGSVTITGNADGVEIESSSGVTVLTEDDLEAVWEELEDAFEACEEHLPEAAFGPFGDFEMFEIEIDD